MLMRAYPVVETEPNPKTEPCFSSPFVLQVELAECLERGGFKSINEAIGADCR